MISGGSRHWYVLFLSLVKLFNEFDHLINSVAYVYLKFVFSFTINKYLLGSYFEFMQIYYLSSRNNCYQFSSVQSFSRVRLLVTPWTEARQASLSITNSRSPPKPMSIESVMPSSHLILCRPLFLLPPIPPSIRVFPNESILCIRWPKYWSFSFNISPSNEYSGLISFRMDWFDLLAVQRTLKNLLQYHSSKASGERCSERMYSSGSGFL